MNNQTPSTEKAAVYDFLCTALRDDCLEWPASSGLGFYDALLEQATYHGVDALLCHTLRPGKAWETLPAQLRETLLARIKNAVVFEMLRAADLADLLKSLDREGIPILILKGCAIAYTHYPEPYLRARCDTDVFISPGDIRKLRQVLLSAGYKLSGHIYKSRQFNAFRTRFGGSVNYDIHWRASNAAKYARVFSHEDARRESVAVPGLDGAFSLKPVHALLLACMHRAGNPGHDPDRLIWLYDIHLLVSAMTESELLEFAQRAVDAGIQVECQDGIDKARTCFATSVPKAVMRTLSALSKVDSFSKRFADSALGLIVDDFKQLPNTRSRLELVREYLFPSGDYLLTRYGKKGKGWIPLLYVRYVLVGFFERFSLQ